jgi:hypothetical protein
MLADKDRPHPVTEGGAKRVLKDRLELTSVPRSAEKMLKYLRVLVDLEQIVGVLGR